MTRVIPALRARTVPLGLATIAFVLCLFHADAARAQTPADLAAAVSSTCAVMSGQQKLDRRTLQYLLLMDEDLADANPVALGIYRGVLHQCPKAYLAYEQRKRSSNPFAKTPLVKGTPTQLVTTPPKTFAMNCRGGHGIASSQGATLIVTFAKASHRAAQGLAAGQCNWVDRGMRPSESTRIVVPLANAAQAHDGVKQINAGGTWTFQVYGANGNLRATAVAKRRRDEAVRQTH
jgi:hypothetical protein